MDLREISAPPASPVTPDLLDAAETLGGALRTLAERFPDLECLILLDRHRNERRLSLAQLWSRARDVQAGLLRSGLRRGAVVVLVLPTGAELFSAYFGTILAGGVPALLTTPVNRVADARVYAERVGGILKLAAADFLYCDDPEARLFGGAAAKQLGKARILRPADLPRCTQPPEIADSQGESIAAIQYSSGSTGIAKGALLSHRAILNNLRATRDYLGITSRTVSVNWLPLYHDMGLINAFLLPLLCGAPTVLMAPMDFMRDPALWLWAIHHYRGVMSWSPNLGYAVCGRRLSDDETEGLDLTSWRYALSAAEPVLADTIETFSKRFERHGFDPRAMTPAYGLAESVCIVTSHPPGEAPLVEVIDRERLARDHLAAPTDEAGLPCVAVGRCFRGVEVEIRGESGAALQDRHVGDIWLRTDFLFDGYRDAPELTACTLVDGWLDTGDRGYLVDGALFFLYRSKDLIVVGGDKYAPHDVEIAINRVPGVRKGCAVAFGLLSEERGTEELAAIVETREEGAEAIEALERAIRTEVIRSMGLGIRHLKLVPSGGIEKTTSGKLARTATRRRYFGERGDGRL